LANPEPPKVVPPRNDPKKVEVYAVSRASQLNGEDPNFHYEWKALDPKNPSYHGRYERRHEIGDNESGFATCEPWQFVMSNEGVTQGRPRDDMGKPVDTAMRHGDLVLMRTTRENAAVYEEIERRKDAAKSRRMASDKSSGNGATQTFKFGAGFNGSHTDLLNLGA